MSQWFGGPGRKAGKTPGGAPEGSAGMSRGRSGRPLPRPSQATNRPLDDESDDFARPPSVPPRERAGQNHDQWAQEVPGAVPQPPGQPQQRGVRSPAQPPYQQAAPQPAQPNYQQQQDYQQNLSQAPYQQSPQNYQQPPYQQPPPNYRQSDYEQQNFGEPRRQLDNPRYDEGYPDQSQEEADTPERVEFKKRLVALIFDFLACYILAMGVMLIPFINSFVSLQLVMCMFLLIRDYVFEGRGVGKNLMGLQVVDVGTGAPCNLRQSAMRNLVLIAPYALTQIVTAILRLVPFNEINSVITTIVWGLCAVYVVIVIPLEVYRAYTRPDGRRTGDELAGTEIIESAMDFSRPLPR